MSDQPRILFMDDEHTHADVVKMAIDALEAAGFEVDAVDKMSATRDDFYKRYYHAFVLDVDMSLVADSEQGDGTDIARFLKAMDVGSRVVMFSARGRAPAWMAAANFHVHAYVHKAEEGSVERLVRCVRSAIDEPQPSFRSPGQPVPQRVAVGWDSSWTGDRQAVVDAIQANLGDSVEIVQAEGLQALAELADDQRGSLGLVAAVAERFSGRSSALSAIDRICALQPLPHVLFACGSDDAYIHSILHIVNARCFRLLDSRAPDFAASIGHAAHEALTWYGGMEIPAVDEEGRARLVIEDAEELLEAARVDPYDDDEELSDGGWADPHTDEEEGGAT